MNMTLDATTIPLLLTAALAIIGACVKAFLTILDAVRHNTAVTEQGQAASKERSDAIHVLVNSNTDKLKAEIEQLRSSLLAANEALADLRLIHRAPGTP